jgi:hypothetical protein
MVLEAAEIQVPVGLAAPMLAMAQAELAHPETAEALMQLTILAVVAVVHLVVAVLQERAVLGLLF